MCILAKRSSQVSQVASGMSQVTAKVLQHILHHPLCDTVTQGVLLKDRGYLWVPFYRMAQLTKLYSI